MRNVSFLKLSALLAGEEPQGGGGAEHLASPQHRGGELRVRGAAGIVLGLQGKAAVLLHGLAALARGGAFLQKVAGVQLDARLGGVQLHADAGLIAGSPCADALAGAACAVDDIAVVVAAAHHGGLGEAGVDLLADGLTGSKVHGGVCHGQDVAGGAGGVVAFQIAGSVDAQLLVQHVAAAVQIEVAVVGQVYNRVGVRGHTVVHAEGIVIGEGIAHRDLQGAGKTVLAVGVWLMLRTTLSKPPNSIVWRITPRSALNGFITFTVVSSGYLLRSKSV